MRQWKERRNKTKNRTNEDDDEVPPWITEAWDWLLRKELGLDSKEPKWLDLPAMMRQTMTSANVMRTNRPEWLAPFNFFLFPILSAIGGYPLGLIALTFDLSPRQKLIGRNGRKRQNPVPDSFRMILNHLFDLNFDHDYFFELPLARERDAYQVDGVLLPTMSGSKLSRVRTEPLLLSSEPINQNLLASRNRHCYAIKWVFEEDSKPVN